jgi:hypothetical protein
MNAESSAEFSLFGLSLTEMDGKIVYYKYFAQGKKWKFCKMYG